MKCLVISAHDYRSPRKAGIHFVTAELAKLGPTRFFSVRYSHLSRFKSDPRESLDPLANQKAMHDGVECYLWKTLVHPFNTGRTSLQALEYLMFSLYSRWPSRVLVEWIRDSDVVFFESGIAPIFFNLVKRLNPTVKTVYVASDDLDTINVAPYVKRTFARIAPRLDAICLKSGYMAEGMPNAGNLYVIPHGFDFSVDDHADPSPYPPGLHAVSLGSMLFDPEFFVVASKAFPQVTFHVIGSGAPTQPGYGPNVRVYGEMPHLQTIPYIKHAAFGIAPYRAAQLPRYLADTSLKLMQYDYFKLPAVCPQAMVVNYASRYGYTPGDADSIVAAVGQALAAEHVRSRMPLHWSEVVQRMLDPTAFPDTRLPPEFVSAPDASPDASEPEAAFPAAAAQSHH
jgi:2-beta-glucuronyltransferase